MTERKKQIRLGAEDNKDVVGLDKIDPVLQRAQEVMARAIIKQRLAVLSDTQALVLRDSGAEDSASEDSASEVWDEMPRLAREHEGSMEDGSSGGGVPSG